MPTQNHAASLVVGGALLAMCGTARADEPSGFRGINWGDSLAAHAKDMRKMDGRNDTGFFARKNDKLTIGRAELTNILYVFYKEKFMGVMLKTKGFINGDALLKAFTAQYGDPVQENPYIKKYGWRWFDVSVSLDCNSVTDNCIGYMVSLPMVKQRESDEQEAAKKAKDDF